MILDQEEALLTSSEDIKCFFYLFKVPRSWRKFFGFGKAVPGDMLGPTFGNSINGDKWSMFHCQVAFSHRVLFDSTNMRRR